MDRSRIEPDAAAPRPRPSFTIASSPAPAHVVSRRGGQPRRAGRSRIFAAKLEKSARPEKLGLRGLPDAVACAQYHYLSNHVGGVKVEFIPRATAVLGPLSATTLIRRRRDLRHPERGLARCYAAGTATTASCRQSEAGFVCTKQIARRSAGTPRGFATGARPRARLPTSAPVSRRRTPTSTRRGRRCPRARFPAGARLQGLSQLR
jgi:hypothetical protein